MEIRQGKKKSDEAYLDCLDEVLLIGEPVGDELQLHTALSGLRPKSHMFWHMTKNYTTSNAEFRRRTVELITRQKKYSPKGWARRRKRGRRRRARSHRKRPQLSGRASAERGVSRKLGGLSRALTPHRPRTNLFRSWRSSGTP